MNRSFALCPAEMQALDAVYAFGSRGAPFSEAETKLSALGLLRMTPETVKITSAGKLRLAIERSLRSDMFGSVRAP